MTLPLKTIIHILRNPSGCTEDEVREVRLAAAALLDRAQALRWRDHVEQRIRTWRQRTMNRSGDMLALDDFMGQDSIEDLVDFVCDEYAAPQHEA